MFNFPFKTLTSGLAVVLGAAAAASPAIAAVQGGTLIYLEQQAHTNLYPLPAGFIPTAVSLTRSPIS